MSRATSGGTIRSAMEINPTDADLLIIVLADWIQQVMDTQIRIEALEHLLKSQTPDLYAAYLADLGQLKKNQSAVRIREELETLRQGLTRH